MDAGRPLRGTSQNTKGLVMEPGVQGEGAELDVVEVKSVTLDVGSVEGKKKEWL